MNMEEEIKKLAKELCDMKKENEKLHAVIVEAREITCGFANSGIVLPWKVNEFNHNSRLDVLEGTYRNSDLDEVKLIEKVNHNLKLIHDNYKETMEVIHKDAMEAVWAHMNSK